MSSLPDYIQRKKVLSRALIRAALIFWALYLIFLIVQTALSTVLYVLRGSGGSLINRLNIDLGIVTILPQVAGIAAVYFLHERLIRWMWPAARPGCPDCGYPIVPNAKVCPECGKPLPA